VDISIIVPVFNEQDCLHDLQEELITTLEGTGLAWEVIYVDDGSTDDSFNRLKAIHDSRPDHVQVIRLRRNFGQTAALAAGFDASKGEIVIPMDADLQNDPSDIPRLLDKLNEGHDVVSGWRSERHDALITRRLPSAIANKLISWATGVHLHDYGCTLKAYRKEIIDHMNLYGETHRFLPALASWAGARVTEIPVNHRPRTRGESKYGLGRTQRVLLDLITVKFLLSYSTKPMQVFGKWGFYAMALGLLAGVFTFILKVFPPYQDVTDHPFLYICIFFLLSGLQLIGLGLLGEINVRTYYESQHRTTYTIRETLGRSGGS
jgi:glycosyltransferase involved in cell wall biosynthesis